jgi:hypothetical protein
VETLPRPADEFRDLAREMVAAIEAAADRDMICGCDTIDVVADHDACWQGFLGDIATNARRLLWLAELDGGSR